jgi:glycosyltransferase involved in cell wall biosynthesis
VKVVQVLPALDGGGVEKGTLEVARYLVQHGHESVVISAGGRLVQTLEQEGSRHVGWDMGRKTPWTFRHVFALRRWLRQEKPDILHLRSRMPAWVCWLAWRGLPVETRPHLVTTVHGLYSTGRYSSIMCRGERVIAVSRTVDAYIRQHYPETDPARIRLIYRGVDAQEFPRGYQPQRRWLEQWQAQYPHLAGQKLLTLPGRLTRLKGHGRFLELIACLRNNAVPVHGLIVGGEDPKRRQYAQELYQQVEALGLSDAVTFTGARRDIRDIYAISDLVLSLSTKPESFGRTVLEALSIGTPVAGYDHGGVGEILSALYPQGAVPLEESLEELAKRVEAVLSHTDRPPIHDNCFTLSAMLENTLAVYEELVGTERD